MIKQKPNYNFQKSKIFVVYFVIARPGTPKAGQGSLVIGHFFILCHANTNGEAIKTVEYVPEINPMIRHSAKVLSTSPPKKYNARTDKKVTAVVNTVRPSVWLTLKLIKSFNGCLDLAMFSRTRS